MLYIQYVCTYCTYVRTYIHVWNIECIRNARIKIYKGNYFIMILTKRCSSHEICMLRMCDTTRRIGRWDSKLRVVYGCVCESGINERHDWSPDPSTLKVGIHRQVFNEETVTTPGGTAFTDNYLGRLEFLFEGNQVCPQTWVYIYAITSFCVLYTCMIPYNTELLSLSSSTQLGSYFGGTVAAVDVNGDG